MARLRAVPILVSLLAGCDSCNAPDSQDSGETGLHESPPEDSEETGEPPHSDDSHTGKPPDTHDDHTGETGDTGIEDPLGSFFDDFEWTGSSDLDIVFDMDAVAGVGHSEVRMCTSPEGWGLGCDEYSIIAHNMSSLDLLVVDDGIIVAGMPEGNNLSSLGVWLDMTQIHALSSPNLEHWGSHIWEVSDSTAFMVVDPALSLDDDNNPRAAYFALPTHYHGDPADYPGDHAIMLATWDGVGFTQQPDPIFEDTSLVDPDLRSFEGVLHLFTTCWGSICHAVGDDSMVFSYDDAFVFGEAQVPHANTVDDQLMVVGQGGGGQPPPRFMIMDKDGSFPAESEQLYTDEENLSFFGGSCTSPVLGYFDGLYITVCSVQVHE